MDKLVIIHRVVEIFTNLRRKWAVDFLLLQLEIRVFSKTVEIDLTHVDYFFEARLESVSQLRQVSFSDPKPVVWISQTVVLFDMFPKNFGRLLSIQLNVFEMAH